MSQKIELSQEDILCEYLDYLNEDLGRMSDEELGHYTDEDRSNIKAKIAVVEAMISGNGPAVITREKVSATIRAMVEKYHAEGVALEEFNKGRCFGFALDVVNALGGESDSLHILEFLGYATSDENGSSGHYSTRWLASLGLLIPEGCTSDDINRISPDHDFIFHGDLFFDAECPDGVPSPFLLPFFVNAFTRLREQQAAALDALPATLAALERLMPLWDREDVADTWTEEFEKAEAAIQAAREILC